MKTLTLALLTALALVAEPPTTGAAQSGVTYTVNAYGPGFFPAYVFIGVQTNNPQTTAVRLTLTFADGSTQTQLGRIQNFANAQTTCASLVGQVGACVFLPGNWANVATFKIEELQVAAVHQVQ